MLFTLEALDARHGDALLLHYGSAANPQLIVIDGGPPGVYRKALKPRLEALRTARTPGGRLPIRMLVISHIDDDHIAGVLQMLRELDELRADERPQPYDILTLWHNSFDDILGNETDVLTAAFSRAIAAAAGGRPVPAGIPLSRSAALLLASVKQGREVRAHAAALALEVNEGFRGLIGLPEGGRGRTIRPGGGLSLVVLGPDTRRVAELRERWDKEIRKMGVARQAAFVDTSVFNLSSLIVLAKVGRRKMLLTGDARGDDILAALQRARLMKGGRCHLDVLKLPHHGSDRNVDTEFFRRVTADHYVVSGNGDHGNPELATFQMLSEGRRDDHFTVHLTNAEDRLTRFFDGERAAGRRYAVVFRDAAALSVKVELGEPLPD